MNNADIVPRCTAAPSQMLNASVYKQNLLPAVIVRDQFLPDPVADDVLPPNLRTRTTRPRRPCHNREFFIVIRDPAGARSGSGSLQQPQTRKPAQISRGIADDLAVASSRRQYARLPSIYA